jgi:hypothetical protein
MLGIVSTQTSEEIKTMTRTSTQDLQEEFLTALCKGQQTMIGALRIWVETVQTVAPKLTGVYAPITDMLPKLPAVSVPFADKLPSPKEAVDGAYGLAEELLANQRKFAEAVLDATASLLPGHDQDLRHPITPMKPVVVRTEPKPAPPKPSAAVVPTPAQVVVKAEPKPVMLRPQAPVAKPPVAATPQSPVAKSPEPPVAKSPEPSPPAPKASAPKAPAPKAAAPKAPAPKAAAPKAPAPKAAAPKAAAPKAPAPKAANAS